MQHPSPRARARSRARLPRSLRALYNGRVTEPRTAASSGWLADTHAHLYRGFAPDRYLECAAAHLDRARSEADADASTLQGCLLIAETAGDRSYSRLLERETAVDRGGVTLCGTAEAQSVMALHADGGSVMLSGGLQLVTREGLEVLIFGTQPAGLNDGVPVRGVLERAASPSTVAILPWGFGKWWFGRGRLVHALIRDHGDMLVLGDNGNRPQGVPDPAPFRAAKEAGVPIVAGSDPLPLAGHAGRAGSYGVVMPCTPDLERPGAQIASLLRRRGVAYRTFGRRLRLDVFVTSQLRLRRRGSRDG